MRFSTLSLLLVLLAATPLGARAAPRLSAPADPAVAQQCSACHMAYPAHMLPARSWQKLMSDLQHHFGEDASLSAQDTASITAYLTANAADGAAGGKDGRRFLRGLSPSATPIRITDTPYWRRRHEEVSERRFNDPKVKTAANCVACHNGQRGALWGLFDDD